MANVHGVVLYNSKIYRWRLWVDYEYSNKSAPRTNTSLPMFNKLVDQLYTNFSLRKCFVVWIQSN